MTLRLLAIVSFVILSAASGCQRKPPTTQAPQGQGVSIATMSTPEAPPPPPPAQPVDGAAPTPAGAAEDSPAMAREREILRLKPPQRPGELPSEKLVIWACDRFLERYGRDAKDINELVSKGLITVPPAPAGKKYLLNAHDCTLTLVDK
jgi:hypothetical protein